MSNEAGREEIPNVAKRSDGAWRCHDVDLVSSTCRCHGREDYVDHVSRPSVRTSIEGRFGISV